MSKDHLSIHGKHLGNNQRQTTLSFVIEGFFGRYSVRWMSDVTVKRGNRLKAHQYHQKRTSSRKENEKRTMKLGGPDCTVQIDESHVFRRKYNIKRQLKITEHRRLFGMAEDNVCGRLFLEMVKERDKPTLEGIIKKHTERGTRIFSDCWKPTTLINPTSSSTSL